MVPHLNVYVLKNLKQIAKVPAHVLTYDHEATRGRDLLGAWGRRHRPETGREA
jgi:hypothetical protein